MYTHGKDDTIHHVVDMKIHYEITKVQTKRVVTVITFCDLEHSGVEYLAPFLFTSFPDEVTCELCQSEFGLKLLKDL